MKPTMDGEKVLYFISDTYPPVGRGGALIRAYYSKYLALEGWQVKVITVKNPSAFFLKNDRDEKLLREVEPYVDIHAVETLNWLFVGEALVTLGLIPCRFINWALSVVRRLPQIIDRPGLVLATYPSVSNLLIGDYIKKKYGLPLVLDFRDEYYGVGGNNVNPLVRRTSLGIETRVVGAADLIFTATEAVKSNLRRRHQVDPAIVHTIYNGYTDELDRREERNPTGKLRVIYAGAIAKAQRPEILNLTYRRLLAQHPELARRLEIEVYGPDNTYFKRVYQETMTAGIEFRGFIPHADLMQRMQAEIDIGFFSLADEVFSYATPTKLFEYINLEMPILAALPEGEAKDIIEKYDIGKVAHYADVDGLAAHLYQYYANPAERLRIKENIRRIKPKFGIETQAKTMSKLLESVDVRIGNGFEP